MKIFRTVLFTLVTLIAVVGAYFLVQWNVIMMENNKKALEKEKALSSVGVRTMANVVNNKRMYGNDGKPSLDDNARQRYEIDYEFVVAGNKYHGKTFVGRDNPTEPIEIVYDPRSPENNLCPAETPTLEISITSLVPVYGFFAILTALLYGAVYKYVR